MATDTSTNIARLVYELRVYSGQEPAFHRIKGEDFRDWIEREGKERNQSRSDEKLGIFGRQAQEFSAELTEQC